MTLKQVMCQERAQRDASRADLEATSCRGCRWRSMV